jgi:hypothetical protein
MRITVDFRDDGYGKHYIVATLPDGTEVDSVGTSYSSQSEAVAVFRGALASIDMTAETGPFDMPHLTADDLVDPAIWPRLTEYLKALPVVEEDKGPEPECYF